MVKKSQRVAHHRAITNKAYTDNDSYIDDIIEDAENFLNPRPNLQKNAKSAKYI